MSFGRADAEAIQNTGTSPAEVQPIESIGPANRMFTREDVHRIEKVVALLRASRSILFITGAGLSADSGLPTYRGIGGLYDGRDPDEDMPIEVLLSKETFQTRPHLTWKYLLQIEEACRAAAPNRGHEVIAEMESAFDRVWVLTQNVDGFHRRAGSRNVIEIHGEFQHLSCPWCRYSEAVENYSGLTMPPRCPECNEVLRPDVVLFGERLPARQLAMYEAEMKKGFDLVFTIGTTSVFPYISAPVLDAHNAGKPSVEINPGETDVSEFVTVKLSLMAASTLQAVWTEFNKVKA